MQTWQQADEKLAQKVKEYRFKNPKVSYQDAMTIVCEQNPALADGYSGIPNRRQSLIVEQFTLDRQLKDPNNPAPDLTKFQYRCNVAETEGWRAASKLYGLDLEKEIKEKIQKEIMSLENQVIKHKKIIENYPQEERRLKEIIQSLQAKLGSNIGHTPTIAEIKNEQDKLLALARDLSDAEEELPKVEAELNALRKKLSQIENGKKFSRQYRYDSPSAELVGRAKEYQKKYKMSYADAVDTVLEEDLVLNEAYMYSDIDQLLGLNT